MDKISSLTHKLTHKGHQSPEDWLGQEARNHKFVVLLFYRGKWNSNNWDYLTSFMDIAPRLREKGGEIFIIVRKNKGEGKKLKKHLGEQCKVISDPKSLIAQKFHITMAKRESFHFHFSPFSSSSSSLSRPASTSFTKNEVPSLLTDELFDGSHPGVLILSSRKNKCGDWVNKSTTKNQYESSERFSPRGLRDLMDLHFGKIRTKVRSSI